MQSLLSLHRHNIMQSTNRAAQILLALSTWAFVSAVIALLIVKILYMTALPASLPNLTSDINNIQDLATLKKISVALADSVVAQQEAGWLLISWGLCFVATWSVIFGLASVYLHRQLSAAHTANTPCRNETFLDLALAGKLELWKAFWGLYIALPITASLAFYGLIAILKKVHVIEPAKIADLIVTPLAYSAILVTFWWAAIIAWRCSANTSRLVWRHLARIAIVLYTILPLAQSALLIADYFGR